MDEKVSFVGLRSGGLMTVRTDVKTPDDLPVYEKSLFGLNTPGVVWCPWTNVYVDASRVELSDVAAGISGINRFTNQLFHPYSVAAHSVIGASLLCRSEKYQAALQFLFHDAPEGLGFSDVNFRLKRMFAPELRGAEGVAMIAVANRFAVPHPSSADVHETDVNLGNFETATLHPAKDKILAAYGMNREDILAKFSPADQKFLVRSFDTSHSRPVVWENIWLAKVQEVQSLIADQLDTERVVGEWVATPDSPPHGIGPDAPVEILGRAFRADGEMVLSALKRHHDAGRLTVNDRTGYYQRV